MNDLQYNANHINRPSPSLLHLLNYTSHSQRWSGKSKVPPLIKQRVDKMNARAMDAPSPGSAALAVGRPLPVPQLLERHRWCWRILLQFPSVTRKSNSPYQLQSKVTRSLLLSSSLHSLTADQVPPTFDRDTLHLTLT